MLATGLKPLTFLFADDGVIPNNPSLPLLIYPKAFDLAGADDPAAAIEKTFEKNGWGDCWRNGVYPYVHYHSGIHETLAVARGRARLRFGGNHGEEIDIEAGDAAILPAGTGHQCLWASSEFLIVGAYPPTGTYDLILASVSEHETSVKTIAEVPLPDSDPVFGKDGPLLRIWR